MAHLLKVKNTGASLIIYNKLINVLLITRSLHAMSIGKQSLHLSSLKDRAENSIKDLRCSRKLVEPEDMSILINEAENKDQDESPVCPILSQSSMELINKYK